MTKSEVIEILQEIAVLHLNKVCVIASPKGVAISRLYPGDCFASLAMTDLPESNAEAYFVI